MTSQTTEWGVLIPMPNDGTTIEQFATLAIATNSAVAFNQRMNVKPTLFRRWPAVQHAKVVYRVVEFGDWLTGTAADEWGVREIWTDGYVETRTSRDRSHAEWSAGLSKDGSTRLVVSRTKRFGDWQPFGVRT